MYVTATVLQKSNCCGNKWREDLFLSIKMLYRLLSRRLAKTYERLSVLFQPCRSCSSLVTLEMSCPVSMNVLNDDDDDDCRLVKL